jgi:hypothetical protein
MVRTAARFEARLATMRWLGRWCAREMRPPSDSGNPIHRLQMKKPAAGFPARAFAISAMMEICR